MYMTQCKRTANIKANKNSSENHNQLYARSSHTEETSLSRHVDHCLAIFQVLEVRFQSTELEESNTMIHIFCFHRYRISEASRSWLF